VMKQMTSEKREKEREVIKNNNNNKKVDTGTMRKR